VTRMLAISTCFLTLVLSLLAGVPTARSQDVVVTYEMLRDGESVGTFESCRGMGSMNEVVEQMIIDGTGREVIRKVPGRLRWPDVICTRGLSSSLALWAWRQQVESGDVVEARSEVVIRAREDTRPIGSWRLDNAFPIEVQAVGAESRTVELIRLVVEGVERLE